MNLSFARSLVVAMLFYLHMISQADVLLGHVVAVSDGDTITVLDDNKQRHVIGLMGIDAPEKAQAFGQKSKQSLSDLVFDKEVSVTWFKKDRYGRTVGQVHVDDTDVCLEQINRGLAWHYKQYEREQSDSDKILYSQSESVARVLKLGLWKDEKPIQPSSFRHKKM